MSAPDALYQRCAHARRRHLQAPTSSSHGGDHRRLRSHGTEDDDGPGTQCTEDRGHPLAGDHLRRRFLGVLPTHPGRDAVPRSVPVPRVSHQSRTGKPLDFTALQIPLALTVVLWVGLYVFSIFEVYRDATIIVAEAARRHAAGSQS